MKYCCQCATNKSTDEFHGDSSKKDGLTSWCIACRKSKQLSNRYGLDRDSYNALVDAQGGRCAICGTVPESGPLFVDHNHTCCPGQNTCGNCVRGLLCKHCNLVLGIVKDSATRLRSAADYLDIYDL